MKSEENRAEEIPPVFYERLRLRIMRKTMNKNAFDKGCWEWEGSKWGSVYGTCVLSLPKGDKMRVNAHRAAYIAFSNQFVLPFDISHCCHQSRCVNPDHLSHEPNELNVERERCRKAGACTGHCYDGASLQACIFADKVSFF